MSPDYTSVNQEQLITPPPNQDSRSSPEPHSPKKVILLFPERKNPWNYLRADACCWLLGQLSSDVGHCCLPTAWFCLQHTDAYLFPPWAPPSSWEMLAHTSCAVCSDWKWADRMISGNGHVRLLLAEPPDRKLPKSVVTSLLNIQSVQQQWEYANPCPTSHQVGLQLTFVLYSKSLWKQTNSVSMLPDFFRETHMLIKNGLNADKTNLH